MGAMAQQRRTVWLFGTLVAAVHFLIFAAMGLSYFASAGRYMSTGARSGIGHWLLEHGLMVLALPLVVPSYLLSVPGPIVEIVIMAANSVVWGGAAALLYRRVRRRREMTGR